MGFWETLSGIGRKVPEIDNTLKELPKDEQFKEHLEKARSIGSLLNIGLDIYSKIKKDLQTPEKQAFGSLIKIVLESTKESLPEGVEIKPKEIKIEGLINELFDLFVQIDNKWGSYLPDNPVIKKFRNEIVKELRKNGFDSEIPNFVMSFNIRIEEKAGSDKDIRNYYNPWQRQYESLLQYLEYVRSYRYSPDGSNRLLEEYYVEHEAVEVDSETLSMSNDDIRRKYTYNIKNVGQFVIDFITENRWILVIGATSGVGKTSMVKFIASDFAANFLNHGKENEFYYIPIVVFLRENFKNVYHYENLSSLLNNIIFPYDSTHLRKTLLILDDFTEYPDKNELLDYIDKLHDKYPNMKILLTTTLHSDSENELLFSRFFKKYVRLLPLSSKQKEESNIKGGTNIKGGIPSTYQITTGLKIPLKDKGPSTHVITDSWTTHDTLGYRLYAHAIARFITDSRTSTPLCIGIQAPWGRGKTSLMRMIQEELDIKGVKEYPNETSAIQLERKIRQHKVKLEQLIKMKPDHSTIDKIQSQEPSNSARYYPLVRKLRNTKIKFQQILKEAFQPHLQNPEYIMKKLLEEEPSIFESLRVESKE